MALVSMLLYIYRNHRLTKDVEPMTATSSFTQLLNSDDGPFARPFKQDPIPLAYFHASPILQAINDVIRPWALGPQVMCQARSSTNQQTRIQLALSRRGLKFLCRGSFTMYLLAYLVRVTVGDRLGSFVVAPVCTTSSGR